ncbi:MAG: hypothetical protein ACHQF0_02600 [Chitinophagales bacterium]
MKFLLLFFLTGTISAHSQSFSDSIFCKINPGKWSASIGKKVTRLADKLIAKSKNTLARLERQEQKICKKQLTEKDSSGNNREEAEQKLDEIQNRYRSLETTLKNTAVDVPAGVRQYIPHLDTLETAFKFLEQNSTKANLKDALIKIELLDNKLQQAEVIKNFVHDRKEQLRQELEQFGLVKELNKYSKEVYYYSERIKECKETLSDPNKIERKAIEFLIKTKLFKDFMRRNSMLAFMFRLPGDLNDPIRAESFACLQTRAQVDNMIQEKIVAGGPNAQQQFQENIQQAQSQLQQLKDKFLQSGRGSSNDIMPGGFKPNSQKTRSFLKRLEYGTNMQTQNASNYFPVTSDLGLSVGYKLNDMSVIGIGVSYKLGFGRGWNNIQFTSEGAGLRSYIDWKIPSALRGRLGGDFLITGGFEMNYRTELRSVFIPSPFGGGRVGTAWQHSGLIGLSKVIDVKSKFFKKTKLQLLWDFLSYYQAPRTQPVVFRVGYNF